MAHFLVNGSHVQLLSLVHMVIILRLCFCKQAVVQKELKILSFPVQWCRNAGIRKLQHTL